ncbi:MULTISPECIES: class I SAM-dependent methyltransferase [Bacillus]|uniref:class I SAM-dependent DNA methyltransferase n=1 Tax=Bacillus TaxID=1386 RepID=UPI00101B5AFA|nr:MULTISPECIES: class I SAM-dependent methyltransferase [Bacillus]RYI31521.1 class I SAM-dependent methyltransferase [Bacillus infantis]
MTYGKFAYLYDALMKDVPYEGWVETVKSSTEKYRIEGKRLLDLACGTGELSVRLAQAGYDVTGVDLSEDMLAVAQAKAMEQGADISFYQQDMSELEGLGEYDIAGIFCDSLNYLQSEKEVEQTFESVGRHLKEGGLFIFDVHSVYKMEHIFRDQTFALNEDEISYIWECFPGEHPFSIEHELTFFQLDPSLMKYDRYDELHLQRTYPIDIYKDWLLKAGFTLLEITADFETELPAQESERIFFICRKN